MVSESCFPLGIFGERIAAAPVEVAANAMRRLLEAVMAVSFNDFRSVDLLNECLNLYRDVSEPWDGPETHSLSRFGEDRERSSLHPFKDDLVIPVDISTLPLRNLPSTDNIGIRAV